MSKADLNLAPLNRYSQLPEEKRRHFDDLTAAAEAIGWLKAVSLAIRREAESGTRNTTQVDALAGCAGFVAEEFMTFLGDAQERVLAQANQEPTDGNR